MNEMFKPVDASQEAAILAADSSHRKKGPDLNIRTYTQWFKLSTKFGTCQVDSHEENVIEPTASKSREMMVYEIDGVAVCRWCYVAGKP